MLSEKTQKALFLIAEGYSAPEITQMLGYKSNSTIYCIAKQHNVKIRKAHDKQHEEMRRYKAEGHTMQEVADKFGVSKQTAQQICKGICPQKARPPKDGYQAYNKGTLQEIENVIRIINERASGFEYAGNYTGSTGSVDIRCKKCGHIHTHSWWSIRHKGVKVCPNCLEIEKQKKRTADNCLALANKITKDIEAERDKRGKEVVRLLTRFSRLHRCPVCGTLTDNKKYCSLKCCQKAQEPTKDANRRKRIKDALIDKDINLEHLYNRDNGICAICGGKCDWSDHQYKGRYFIVGKNYPSIDHIVPLSWGGLHSWENVQLAHHGCNTTKGARYCG